MFKNLLVLLIVGAILGVGLVASGHATGFLIAPRTHGLIGGITCDEVVQAPPYFCTTLLDCDFDDANYRCTGSAEFNCTNITNDMACGTAAPKTDDKLDCIWNYSTATCQNFTSAGGGDDWDDPFSFTDPCSGNNTVAACNVYNSQGCFWDNYTYYNGSQGQCLSVCEPPVGSSNDVLVTDNNICINIPLPGTESCEWSGGKCKMAFTGHTGGGAFKDNGCPQFDGTSNATCVGNAVGLTCVWSQLMETCDDAYGYTSGGSYGGSVGGSAAGTCNDICSMCANESTCNNSISPMGCEWSSSGSFCKGKFFMPGMGGGMVGGAMSCSSSCFGCFTNLSCSNSSANCTWTSDPFAFTGGGPGGFCDPAAMAQYKSCDTTCMPCFGETECNSSKYSNNTRRCFWNTTYVAGEAMCLANGTAPEICWNPGDEDGDGDSDCSDSECLYEPFCGFGSGGGGAGGPGQGVFLPNPTVCFDFDNTNESLCEALISIDSSFPYNGSHRNASNVPSHLNLSQVCTWHTGPPGSGLNFCDPKGERDMIGGGGPAMGGPKIITIDEVADTYNLTTQPWLDIKGVGAMETPVTIDMGILIKNMTNFVGCAKSYSASTNQLGKYYRFLDVDSNTTNNCNATGESGTVYRGFEYMIKYEANSSTNNSHINLSIYRCSSESWVVHTSAAKPSVISDPCWMPEFVRADLWTKKDINVTGANVVLFQKKDIGNPTTDIRVFVSTANATTSHTNPVDSVGPMYYTPGAMDYEPVDCMTDPSACGSIIQFQPPIGGVGGFMKGEDCSPIAAANTLDFDQDGDAGCNDPDCYFEPWCAGTYDSSTDNTFPKVLMTTVKEFIDFVGFGIATNEPTNASIKYYFDDSNCVTLNETYFSYDDPAFTFDDYMPFHWIEITGLASNTTYYYATSVVDQANHTSESKCLNFTTASSHKTVKFTMPYTPPSDITDPTDFMGGFGVQLKPEGSDSYQDWDVKDNVKDVNTSNSKNVEIKISNPTASSNKSWEIIFKNASLSTTKNLNMTGNMNVTDLSNSTANSTFLGIDTDHFEEMKQSLGPDEIEIKIPNEGGVAIDEIWKCNDNNTVCNNITDELLDNCDFEAGFTECNVTPQFAFSSLKTIATTTTTTTTDDTTTTSGGGGGGGGGGVTVTTHDLGELTTVAAQKEVKKDEKINFKLENESHTVTVLELTNTSIKLEVKSDPVNITLTVGQTKKLDLDNDTTDYDVSIKLESINTTTSKAKLTFKKISEKKAEEKPEEEKPSEEKLPGEVTPGAPGAPEEAAPTAPTIPLIYIIAIIVIIIVIVGALFATGKIGKGK